MAASLKQRIEQDVKSALRARDKQRLSALRMATAAIKQREIDSRSSLDDAGVLTVLEKMLKQRREALEQYERAGRQELADQERFEIRLLEEYMPTPLSDAEIDEIIASAIAETGAQSMKDMGRVMGQIKPRIQGRADMGAVSARVKKRLA